MTVNAVHALSKNLIASSHMCVFEPIHCKLCCGLQLKKKILNYTFETFSNQIDIYTVSLLFSTALFLFLPLRFFLCPVFLSTEVAKTTTFS